jgi:mannose-6-phosphate isomerase-like protein (cupin superfamily)
MNMLRVKSETKTQERKREWLQVTPGERFVIRTSSQDTMGVYTIFEFVADHLNGVPIHIHQNEDEHFIILEGTAHFMCGDRRWDAAAGSAFTISKGVPHAWCNLSETPVRMLVIFSPGHIEALFREVAKGGNIDLAAIGEKFGTRIVGPTLFEDVHAITSPRGS